MDLISGLRADHRQLEAQFALLVEVTAGEIPDAASIAALRWGMAQKIHDHCAQEDRGVYQWLIASGDIAAINVAYGYRRDHGRLEKTFDNYIADWPVGRIAKEWGAFRIATREMVDEVKHRIAIEEQVLFDHVERIRRRRAA